MAFPWIQHDNFEDGTVGSFVFPHTDQLGKLDFPCHKDGLPIPPYRGGYVMRVDLYRGVDDAYVQHSTSFDIGNGTSRYLRFYLMLSEDFFMPPGASMRIVSWYDGITEEVSIVLDRTDPNIEDFVMSMYDQDDNSLVHGLQMTLGKWMCIEFLMTHAGASSRCSIQYNKNTIQQNRMNFGTFTFSHWRMGAMQQNAGIRGTLYFDDVIVDEEKLNQPEYLDPEKQSNQTFLVTKTAYLFVGPGELKSAAIVGGAAGNSAFFYDTDALPFAHHNLRATLKVSSAESRETVYGPILFRTGCYVVISGSGGTQPTDPQLLVSLGRIGKEALTPAVAAEVVSPAQMALPPPTDMEAA